MLTKPNSYYLSRLELNSPISGSMVLYDEGFEVSRIMVDCGRNQYGIAYHIDDNIEVVWNDPNPVEATFIFGDQERHDRTISQGREKFFTMHQREVDEAIRRRDHEVRYRSDRENIADRIQLRLDQDLPAEFFNFIAPDDAVVEDRLSVEDELLREMGREAALSDERRLAEALRAVGPSASDAGDALAAMGYAMRSNPNFTLQSADSGNFRGRQINIEDMIEIGREFGMETRRSRNPLLQAKLDTFLNFSARDFDRESEKRKFRWRPAQGPQVSLSEMATSHIFYCLRRMTRGIDRQGVRQGMYWAIDPDHRMRKSDTLVSKRFRLQAFLFIWELEERNDLEAKLANEYDDLLSNMLGTMRPFEIEDQPTKARTGRKIIETKTEIVTDGQKELKGLGLIAGNRRLNL